MRLLLTLAGLTCALPVAAQEKGADTKLVEAARARQEAVKTLDVLFLVNSVVPRGGVASPSRGGWREIPHQETAFEATCRLVLDHGKVRYEDRDFVPASGQFREFHSLTTFDGSTYKLLTPGGSARAATGAISETRRFPTLHSNHVLPLYLAFRGVTPNFSPITLADLKPTGVTRMIDGTPCQEYASAPWNRSSRVVWVDPTRDHVIRRLQLLADVGWFREGRVSTQYDIDYRKETACGWAPTSWAYQQFTPKGEVRKTVKVEVLRMRFNEPQPAERFDLQFPPGTFVYDETNGKEYRIQPDGSRREIVPVRKPSPPPPSPSNGWVPVTLGVLLVVLAACWYLVRREQWRQG